jgi:uncharacterized SAM-binding protein YcdF (DUF218 family)
MNDLGKLAPAKGRQFYRMSAHEVVMAILIRQLARSAGYRWAHNARAFVAWYAVCSVERNQNEFEGTMRGILSALTTPSGVAHVLFLLGVLAVFFARTRTASWWLLAGSGATTLVFSSGMVAAALMSPLEYEYPRLTDGNQYSEVKTIVVLTAWAGDDPDMPLTGRYSPSAAYRVLMALELYKERPDCDVIISGDRDTARLMGDGMVKLGLPVDKLTLEDQSLTTAESALMLKPMLGNRPFFLITSAGHLPRTMGVLAKQGLNAVPVPTDHQLPRSWKRAEWNPSPSSLMVSDRALHEYLGLLWYRLRDRI